MSFSFIDEDNISMWKKTGTRACTSQKNMEKFEGLSSTENLVENFNESSSDSPSPITFTLYYANWCPHCTDVKPIFKKYTGKKMINGKTVIVQMIEEKEMSSSAPRIPGFPSFILQKDDGSIVSYNGGRSADKWNSFLNENV